MIKLDAMENPYGLPARRAREIAAAVANVPVNRYPGRRRRRGEGGAAAGARAAATTSALVLGNGSDELIQMLTAAVAQPGAVVLAPEPSFVHVPDERAIYADVRFVGVPLRADFTLDIDAMLAAIARERPALVWLAYPNNPTGNLFARARHRAHPRARRPGWSSSTRRTTRSPTRRSCRACSSFPTSSSCARCRRSGWRACGWATPSAHPAWIAELDKVRPPYNVNALTQAVVPVLLARTRDLLAEQAAAIRRERARMATALGALRRRRRCFRRTPISCWCACRTPPHWFATLRDAGILVKNLDGWHPLLAGCLRITVGTPAENDAVLEALSRYRERRCA